MVIKILDKIVQSYNKSGGYEFFDLKYLVKSDAKIKRATR
jgi:hypothetical protein